MRLCLYPAFACLLFLQSCAFSSQPAPPCGPEPGPVAAFLRDAGPGEAREIDDPAFGGPVSVRFEEEFTSAAGEQCRRGTAVARASQAEVVVICRKDGGWVMAPRVWGEGISPGAAR